MPRNSRMSIGGSSAFTDGSPRYNLRSASAPRSRRISLGSLPSASNDDGGNEKQDRRAMLEEWRKQVRSRSKPPTLSGSSSSETNKENNPNRMYTESNKRAKTAEALPRIPRAPINSHDSGTEGTTALERFRMRRTQQQQIHQKTQIDHLENDNESVQSSHASQPSPHTEDMTVSFSSRITTPKLSISASTRTSSSSRRRSMSLGAGPRRRTRCSISPADTSAHEIESRVQKTDTSSINEDVSAAEEAGLKSRVNEMQQRITQLEREKLDLTKSKAPLEARFRQKEDSWLREKKRLVQEVNALKTINKEADEQYRGLELKTAALEEERNKLKYEALKASVNFKQEKEQQHNNTENISGNWTRQLQNDRDVADLRIAVRDAEDEIGALRLDKVSLEADLEATQRQLHALQTSHDELVEEFDDNQDATTKAQEAEIQLQVLTTEHIATAAQLHAVCADLAQTKSSSEARLEETKQGWKDEVAKMKFEISVLKNSRATLCDADITQTFGSGSIENNEAILKARIEERDAKISELESQLAKGEELRREMHNRIQELRGNIRVFVRTRPFLPGDGDGDTSAIDVLPNEEGLSISDPKRQNRLHFGFDKVFPPSAGQDYVFQEVSDFVQSALDGYNVCLFSYGQTGSGKTHTMQGSGNGVMRGIIPRAVEKILSQSRILQDQKWKFNMTASFLEIYNETLRDLLAPSKENKRSTRESKLSIKRNAEGKSYVDGLSKIPIDTENAEYGMEQLDKVMACAARSRSVAKTKMNSQSSRSHSVFMLHLHGFNEDSETVVNGSLNLCDLAGSERLDRSGAGADIRRLKETQAINKSLSCLADVFNSLANGSSHIPFRNSKLTYLLQDCLSGDGKALMFVNLSPTEASRNESLCSLRFAQRVNQVELGKPIKHVQYSSK